MLQEFEKTYEEAIDLRIKFTEAYDKRSNRYDKWKKECREMKLLPKHMRKKMRSMSPPKFKDTEYSRDLEIKHEELKTISQKIIKNDLKCLESADEKTRDYILNYLTDDDIINNEIYLAKTYPNKLKQMITHNMLDIS